MVRSYIYGAVALAVIAGLSTALYMAYSAGRQSVLTKLADDRVTVLKDGKIIDDRVLAADDDALVCMLIDCK